MGRVDGKGGEGGGGLRGDGRGNSVREVMKCKDNKEASRWNTFEPANRTAPQSVFRAHKQGCMGLGKGKTVNRMHVGERRDSAESQSGGT